MKYIRSFKENSIYTDDVSPYIRDGYNVIKVDNIDKVRDKSKIIYLNNTTAEHFIKLAEQYTEILLTFKRLMTATDFSKRFYDVSKEEVGEEYNLYYVDRDKMEYTRINPHTFIDEYKKPHLYYILPDKVESVKGVIETYKEKLKLIGDKIDTVAQMTKLMKQENETPKKD